MQSNKQFTEVEFGQQKINVPKDGYYDRFRMNPDLDQVAQDPAVGNIDFFRKIPKKLVESRVGPVWAPNFYYRSGNVQLLMLAPLKQLKKKLPASLEPLQVFPGYGLVALTFFTYAVCDNDPYNEVSVAIVVRKPNAYGPHALELINSIRQRHFYAHVLALPVDTEIARVRGVYGYQLPKWLTEINVAIGSAEVNASLTDMKGKIDLSLIAPTPHLQQVKSESRMSQATMLHQVDGKWQQTLVQSNLLSFGQKLLPSKAKLVRHGGPLSQLLDELGASKILRLDVIQDAQVVLHLPKAL
ncbi:acetoacetate decarboxylase [Acinetobacter sp. C26M]|uniref:acetoacetate decarboxylase n=1 Tax=unclassified Acinetobacter TaxID=196816 RepID=UPI00203749EF|nr:MULTISPECIES: acetoacetate decarboxylase [unclassified Acinetobacter]USA48197.1 acetoacetate decarboxylase [Acinetobacter sp. C26M]USA51677.1 acetoacetate decarboxylase [Acinetobacter sp. C26G]